MGFASELFSCWSEERHPSSSTVSRQTSIPAQVPEAPGTSLLAGLGPVVRRAPFWCFCSREGLHNQQKPAGASGAWRLREKLSPLFVLCDCVCAMH